MNAESQSLSAEAGIARMAAEGRLPAMLSRSLDAQAFAEMAKRPQSFEALSRNVPALRSFAQNARAFEVLGRQPAFRVLMQDAAFSSAVRTNAFAEAVRTN